MINDLVRVGSMASHSSYEYEDRGQRMRHRVGTTSRAADSTVACTR